MKKYDLCIIGGGPAGYAAAMRAMDFDKKVILIEKYKLGGAEIYNGVLASKAMWEHANRHNQMRKEFEEMDGKAKIPKVSFKTVKKIINEATFERKFQLTCHLRIIHAETSLITYEKGVASFVDNKRIKIVKANSEEIIYAENTIVATGSSPRVIEGIKVDEKNILTSNGIMNLKKFPKSLVIVGAGVIGCEFATIFSNYRQTKVYLIDSAEHILPSEDRDISKLIEETFEQAGIIIHKNSSLKSMRMVDGEVEYVVRNKTTNECETFKAEKALLSIGRVPNVKSLKLENAGIKIKEGRNHINDKDTETNTSNIYAAGDVSGGIALANVAEREARHAVVKLYSTHKVKKLNYENVSSIMFLNPVVATVGAGEKILREKNIPYRVSKVDYSTIARAVSMRETTGFFKLIVSDDDDMKVLGMRAAGYHASSAIQAVSLLIYMKKGIDELAHMLHPHPTIVEGIQEAARMLIGKSIYKSAVFKDKLKCYRFKDGVATDLITLDSKNHLQQSNVPERMLINKED